MLCLLTGVVPKPACQMEEARKGAG